MGKVDLDELRIELSIGAKNGIDFTLAASLIWIVITLIWRLEFKSYDKSVLVFIAGGPMLPLALLFSKVLKTNWKMKHNPLQPLGLWLNFAQLFYFPFLIFIMIKSPEYFVMVLAMVTGGHFFPYAWFYKAIWYAVFAGVIVIGSLLLGLNLPVDRIFYVPAFTSLCLIILTVFLYNDLKKKVRTK
jgi:hypothetical protein